VRSSVLEAVGGLGELTYTMGLPMGVLDQSAKVRFDWTIKVSDAVRIIVLIVGIIIAYDRLNARVENVEKLSQATAQQLSEHINEQNETTGKVSAILERLIFLLENFPPHVHTSKGEILYPQSDGMPKPPKIKR
jgi:hypothetical protein